MTKLKGNLKFIIPVLLENKKVSNWYKGKNYCYAIRNYLQENGLIYGKDFQWEDRYNHTTNTIML